MRIVPSVRNTLQRDAKHLEAAVPETFNPDLLLTYEEAAQALHVSAVTIQLWVEGHVIKGVSLPDGEKRVAQQAVVQLVKDRAGTAGTPKNRLTDSPAPRNLRILVVDDSDATLQLCTSVINSWGLPTEVTIARNGFDGLVRVGAVRPDLVISDLEMPGMDGFQMIRTLQKPGPGYVVPVFVVVSGLDEEAIERRGGLPQNIQMLHKPIDFGSLKELVRSMLLTGPATGTTPAA